MNMTLPRPSCMALVLAKVFQGLLMVKADHADTQDKILRLWCHEESRVFRDRLISAEDRTWFNNALQVNTAPFESLLATHVSLLFQYFNISVAIDQIYYPRPSSVPEIMENALRLYISARSMVCHKNTANSRAHPPTT